MTRREGALALTCLGIGAWTPLVAAVALTRLSRRISERRRAAA